MPATVSNLKMPRVDSQLALVSYLADDEDVEDPHDARRHSTANQRAVAILESDSFEILSESLKFAESSSAPNSVKSSEPADDLDSYTLLEKTLDSSKNFFDHFKADLHVCFFFV